MLKDGMRICEIHKSFNSIVTRYAIRDIKLGRSWKNVAI